MKACSSRTGWGAYHLWAQEEVRLGCCPKSGMILEACFTEGVTRADAAAWWRERAHARRIVSALMKRGVLISDARARRCASFSGGAGLALDAWAVSREDSLGRYPLRREVEDESVANHNLAERCATCGRRTGWIGADHTTAGP